MAFRVIVLTGFGHDAEGNFVGCKGVGKDTVADELQRVCPHDRRIALAGKLKKTLADTFDINEAMFSDPDRKEMPIPHLNGWSARSLAEQCGTEVVRVGMGCPEVWLDHVKFEILKESLTPIQRMAAEQLMLSYDHLLNPNEFVPRIHATPAQALVKQAKIMSRLEFPEPPQGRPRALLVTDCRFYNEYAGIIDLCAQLGVQCDVVQVRRHLPGVKPTAHSSNQHDPRMVPDIVVQNESLDDLPALLARLGLTRRGTR